MHKEREIYYSDDYIAMCEDNINISCEQLQFFIIQSFDESFIELNQRYAFTNKPIGDMYRKVQKCLEGLFIELSYLLNFQFVSLQCQCCMKHLYLINSRYASLDNDEKRLFINCLKWYFPSQSYDIHFHWARDDSVSWELL